MKYFKFYFSKHRGMFFLSILFSVLGALCFVVPYGVTGKILELLLSGSKDFSLYVPYLYLLLLLLILGVLFQKGSTALSHVATFSLLASMRRDLAEKLARVPLGVIGEYSSGALKDILVEKVDKMETTFAHVIPEVTGNILACLFTFCYLFYLDWHLALVSLLMFVLSIAMYFLSMGDYKSRFANYIEKNKVLNNVMVEYIGGISVIKAFNQSGKAYGKLVKAVEEGAASAIDWFKETYIAMAILFVFLPSTVLGVLPVGALMVQRGSLSLSMFLTILLLNFSLVTPLLIAAAHGDNLATVAQLFSTITKLFDVPDLLRPEVSLMPPKSGDIVFEDVSFAYGEAPVLQGINLTFPENSVSALVGPSGGGKSTITRLLAGFYEPKEGKISIGGQDLKNMSLKDSSALFAYVSQDDFLFNRTIMENLRVGNLHATDEEIMEICKKSGVHDFILSLEKGYDTLVGSKGLSLSGGERQRISIARAMIKDAPIIIFDEATAFSDPENEYVLQQGISALTRGKTLIVVAHRLSTITDSDHIFLIEKGQVAASGTHGELLDKSPLYRKMFETHMAEGKEVSHDYVLS